MANPLSKSNGLLNSIIRPYDNTGQSLAMQHLEYTVTIDSSRAMLASRAMNNTAYLMNLAGEIMEDNPACAGAMREIMEAYVDAAAEGVYDYGRPISSKTRR